MLNKSKLPLLSKIYKPILKDIENMKADCGIKLQIQNVNGWEDCSKDILEIS